MTPTLDIGGLIVSMGKAYPSGGVGINTTVSTTKDTSRALESFTGLISPQHIVESGLATKCKARVFSFGMMGRFTRVSSGKTRKRELVASLGLTAKFTRVNSRMTKKRAMVTIISATEGSFKGGGIKASSMD